MQANDAASGATELPLQRLHTDDRRMEIVLEEFRKNFHESERSVLTKITLPVLQG